MEALQTDLDRGEPSSINRTADPEPQVGGLAILLVDDDPDIAAMFGFGLRAAGYDVVLAGDGGIAVGLATRTRFDLVLLDVNLPHVDGIEALRLLRSHPSTRDLPVVMFTNSDDQAIRSRAQSLGISDWLVKSRVLPGDLAQWIAPCSTSAGSLPSPAT